MLRRVRQPSGPAWGLQAVLAFSIVDRFCMALLYGRAGRLTTQNGGFRPGQSRSNSPAALPDVAGGRSSNSAGSRSLELSVASDEASDEARSMLCLSLSLSPSLPLSL